MARKRPPYLPFTAPLTHSVCYLLAQMQIAFLLQADVYPDVSLPVSDWLTVCS